MGLGVFEASQVNGYRADALHELQNAMKNRDEMVGCWNNTFIPGATTGSLCVVSFIVRHLV